jgi:hypothetical protein
MAMDLPATLTALTLLDYFGTMVFACGGSIIAGESGMDFMGCLLMVRIASSAVLLLRHDGVRVWRIHHRGGVRDGFYGLPVNGAHRLLRRFVFTRRALPGRACWISRRL